MNETLKVLEERRSCRKFKPDMITEEELNSVIRAGTFAPTGMGKQSPIIIAVTNKEMRDKIAEENRKIGNLLNAAESLGLGSIWIHRAKEEFESDFGKSILKELGIEGDYEGIGHCALGYQGGNKLKPAPRKENYVYYIK